MLKSASNFIGLTKEISSLKDIFFFGKIELPIDRPRYLCNHLENALIYDYQIISDFVMFIVKYIKIK